MFIRFVQIQKIQALGEQKGIREEEGLKFLKTNSFF
tara:strand:+ start:352 stop:459 length:108 start_codon:yes stop_codon:yes gene_type:complete